NCLNYHGTCSSYFIAKRCRKHRGLRFFLFCVLPRRNSSTVSHNWVFLISDCYFSIKIYSSSNGFGCYTCDISTLLPYTKRPQTHLSTYFNCDYLLSGCFWCTLLLQQHFKTASTRPY